MARRLADENQTNFEFMEEAKYGLQWEARRIARRQDVRISAVDGTWKYARPAYLMNWLACYFLTRPEPERDRIAREGRAVFDARMASERPVPFRLDGDSAAPAEVAGIEVARPLGGHIVDLPAGAGGGKPGRRKDQARGVDHAVGARKGIPVGAD
jgi:hypothetical protein